MTLKIMCPAKINLILKVETKREDGFHPIESIMQSISLCDMLEIDEIAENKKILLSGSSKEIPYDNKNIAYRAAELFFEETKINSGVKIYIEKNIPVCAGLAGGSTDGAGVLYGLNKIFDMPLSTEKLLNLCVKLGSDLNFCLKGGLCVARGRGEILSELEFKEFDLCIVKPKNLKISAREAYEAFDGIDKKSNMPNDLEFALLPRYKELLNLHNAGFQMSGSGPSFFALRSKAGILPDGEYEVFENLKSLPHGVLSL